MKSKIAVIMSIYRNGRIDFVKLAVESILNQTYKDFDYYFQYDGSVNADDILKVNRFEKLLEYFKNHLELDCLGIGTIEITSSGDEYFKLAA